jgi:RHS repeat-associated protein
MTRTTIFAVHAVVLAALSFTPAASAHYDPVQGRWLERDPIGVAPTRNSHRIGQRYPDGASLYSYVRANPIRYTDVSGRSAGTPDPGNPPPPVAPAEVNPTSDNIPQCKDEKGNPVELTFNGNSLKGNGFCATAVSGRDPTVSVKETDTKDGQYIEETWTFDYSKQRQRQRNTGPMPEGCYSIRTDHEDSTSGTNNPAGEPARRHHWPKSIGWGDYSWPLTPYPGTDVNDEEGKPRSGMFLHGGSSPGSAGCGDVYNGADTDLHDFMDRLRKINGTPCYVKVCSRYPSPSASIVRKSFYPYYMGCGCSISPWMPK